MLLDDPRRKLRPSDSKGYMNLWALGCVLRLALQYDTAFALGFFEASSTFVVDHDLWVQERLERHGTDIGKVQRKAAGYKANSGVVELAAVYRPMYIPAITPKHLANQLS
mmetsp:Transcript_21857/g.26917  ORF Transcript_21857/g.26917 Transcript_21857/m.26917 type:complete len:110 (+) Transcript_21857:264-593(+)